MFEVGNLHSYFPLGPPGVVEWDSYLNSRTLRIFSIVERVLCCDVMCCLCRGDETVTRVREFVEQGLEPMCALVSRLSRKHSRIRNTTSRYGNQSELAVRLTPESRA